MSDRKEKVAKRKANRNNAVVNAAEYESTHSDNGRVLDAAVKTAEAVRPVVGEAEVMNPTDAPKKRPYDMTRVAPVVGEAEVMNPTGITRNRDTSIPTPQSDTNPRTWQDILDELKQSAINDKTNAVKMQKYYALSDVLNAIGKMGGTAIGGAIGGNVLDSAPATEPYKESRGYLDAFERAKQANERLRKLDEQEFNLAYSKQEKEDERAYAAQQKADERAYKAEMDEIDFQRQKDLLDYRAKIEQAALEGNLELKAKYEAEAAVKEQEYWEKRAAINHRYNMEEKELGHKYSQWQANTYNTEPISFSDGTTTIIPDNYYKALKRDIIGETIGGVFVDKDNVDEVIKNNPQYVIEYMKGYGIDLKLNGAPKSGSASNKKNNSDVSFPYHISRIPERYMNTPNESSSAKKEEPVEDEDGVEWL